MTGQVKEEIMTRRAELGLFVRHRQICFDPLLLRREEFLAKPAIFEYVDVAGERQNLRLERGSLAFTMCQTVFVVHLDADERVIVRFSDRTEDSVHHDSLGPEVSEEIFRRTGRVARVDVFVDACRTATGRPTDPSRVWRPATGGDGR
jgi:hypothetical protein